MNIFLTEEDEKLLKDKFGEIGKAAMKMGVDLTQMDTAMNEALKKGTVKDEPTCACDGEVRNAVPAGGNMTFTGYPDEILRTIRNLLGSRKIEMTIDWAVIDK